MSAPPTDPFDDLIFHSIERAASDVVQGDAMVPEAGDLIAQYRIVERLGAGGMGVVFKATDTRLERLVALKFLKTLDVDDGVARSALAREARAASALNDRRICTVYDVNLEHAPAFIAMELLEGETLRERLARGTLTEAAALAIARDVASALAAAHERGLVHCDVKPANIFLTSRGETKVLDFGIARLRRDTATAPPASPSGGSRGYMSPEQAEGEPLDQRSDIYSFGILLGSMIATPSARLRVAVRRMCEPEPGRRYQTMVDVMAALDCLERRRTNTRRLALAAAVMTVAVALPGIWRLSTRPAPMAERDQILIGDFDNRTGQAVFDNILRDAVEVKFEQSPYLAVVPAARIAETLELMRRKPGDRLTADVAREICERRGIKAFTAGSIATVGSHFVIRLDVINAHTGALLASQQAEATDQTRVLAAIDGAASASRRRLGESLQSLKRFDVPIAVATTGSIEAFRLFRQGRSEASQGTAASMRAAGFFKRAIAIDPEFALAYAQLGIAYRNARQLDLADEAMRQAFARRERASPRERFQIEASYYGQATGEVTRAVETMHAWADAYPDDARPHNSLMVYYKDLGQLELAAEQGERAVAMAPSGLYRANLAAAYVRLHQYDRAIAVASAAIRDGADNTTTHRMLHTVARLTHDEARAATEEAWMSRRTRDFAYISYQASLAGSDGRLGDARRLFKEALALTARAGLDDRLDQTNVRLALLEAYAGNAAIAIGLARQVLDAHPNEILAADAIAVLAVANDAGAQSAMAALVTKHPTTEFISRLWQPLVAGLGAQASGDHSAAIASWRLLDTYDRGDNAWLRPSYHLGLAYLAAGDLKSARQRFEKVIEYHSVDVTRPLFALAYLGLARVTAASGDADAARTAYDKFFEVWSTADAELPIMRDARSEYARLRRAS